jgi:hypothetical protein
MLAAPSSREASAAGPPIYRSVPRNQLKHGHDLKLQTLDKANSPITITVPLADFADAYDGEPQEPKVFEMTTKKMQANIEERKSRCGGQSQ